MKNNKSTALIASAITIAALALSATAVFADSAKIYFSDNSHYYQRFDSVDINWDVAKLNCETLKGHLATFPGDGTGNITPERAFVYSNLANKSLVGGTTNKYYFLGAKYNTADGTWSWVTQEPWGWTHPTPTKNYNYFAMWSGDGYWYFKPVQSYGDVFHNDHTAGYLCEWDSNYFVGSTSVPDLNGNGVDEIASLYLDHKNNKHTVKIRDPQSHVTISTLTFATSTTPPIGLAVIAGNGFLNGAKIAVLSNLNVQIKDAKNNSKVLKSIKFLNRTYQPRALSVMPDTNNNGFDELTVLGILKTGKATSETRDSGTGVKLFSDTF